jgi:phospholipid/cholesterol/gamma-HCH transport system permease protein
MLTQIADSLTAVARYTLFALQVLRELPFAAVAVAEVGRQIYVVLLGSLPMALVAGAALGMVSWLQIRNLLSQFQADSLMPSALALAVVWEFGPVAAGLIAAARVGAGLGAELGSMRITEQIDALEMLAVSPLRRLVAPRVLACMIALPLLAVFIDYVAILSSYAAEALGGNMSWTQYRLESLRFLHLGDAIPATLKTVVFGFFIGISGCYCGINAGGGTEGVGQASTRAVVLSTLLVLLSDVFLVRLIQLSTPTW